MPGAAAPAAASAHRPTFSGELGQGVQASPSLHVTGPANTFQVDNSTVWAVLKAPTIPPVGHHLNANIYTASGVLVVKGDNPQNTDGKGNTFPLGFYLAGRPWAVFGGNFVLKAFWDNDPAPVATLPFTVNIGNRWALVVGIHDYVKDDGTPVPLPGTDHDADSMYDVLVKDFGFPADHVHRLGESQRTQQFPKATKAAILQELEWLVNAAGPNDTAVFFYAGHGALVPDLSGEQEDGWDPSIVPVDHTWKVVTADDIKGYITHRELRARRRRFKTSNVTIIFDSCHSGGAVRKAEEQPPEELGMGRSISVSVSPEVERQRIEAVMKRRANPPPASMETGDRYTFLAAARSWETSTGYKYGGAFTNALVQKLREGGGKSWDDVLSAVRDEVTTKYPNQEANGDGRLRRYPFSLAEAAQDAPYARPTVRAQYSFASNQQQRAEGLLFVPENQTTTNRPSETNMVTLEGRENIWAEQIGAPYAAYPPGTQQPSGPRQGLVSITGQQACKGDPSKEECTDNPFAAGEILEGVVNAADRLVPVSLPYPVSRPRVAVIPEPGGTTQAVSNWLATQPDLQMVSTSRLTDADYVVKTLTYGSTAVLTVWARDLAEVARFPYTSASASEIAKLLTTRHSQFTRLVKLHNPSPSFGFRAEVDGADRQHSADETLTIRGTTRENAWVRLFVANENQPPQMVGFPVVVTHDKPFTLSYTIPTGTQGRLVLKLLVSTKSLNISGFNLAPAAQRVDTLFRSMQASYPPPLGSAVNSLTADGWADASMIISVR